MPPIDQALRAQRETILRVASHHGARRVRLFGSFARGESRPDSDIDLLVDLEPGRSLLDLVGLKQDLEDLLGREIDVLTEMALSPYIREAVLKEAVELPAAGEDPPH